MGWIEGILGFLRQGPKAGKLDMNALFSGALSVNQVDKAKAISEINELISWQEARKKWHQDKTRQKMAAEGGGNLSSESSMPVGMALSSSDFGLDQMDLQDMNYEEEDGSSDEDEANDDMDPIELERHRRLKKNLRRTAGEPAKPEISEVYKLKDSFLAMLRMVLAE
jgi:hypothetical protein